MTQKEIPGLTSFTMMGVALAIDLIEIFGNTATGTFSEFISGAIQYGLFYVWFKGYGCNFLYRKSKMGKTPKVSPEKQNTSPQELLSLDWRVVLGLILESIPLVGYLPIFTFNVYQTIKNESVKEQQNDDSGTKIRSKTNTQRQQNPNVIRGKETPSLKSPQRNTPPIRK